MRETLWRRAYGMLAEKQPDLGQDYGKHLQGDVDDVDGADLPVLADPERIKATIANLLEAREKRQWSIKLGGKTVKVKDQVETLAKLLVWSDKIIKDALSAQPTALGADAHHEFFDMLLEAGADPNQANHAGQIPLHVAKSRLIVELLIKAGSEVNIRDSKGSTPLHYIAASFPDTKASAICELVRAGARLNDVNSEGQTALHLALKGEAIQENQFRVDLVHYGSNDRPWRHRYSTTTDEGYITLEHDSTYEEEQDSTYEKEQNSNYKEKSSHIATNGYGYSATEILVHAGANKDAQDKMLRSPLHYAAADGPHVKTLKLLLRHGASPLLADKDGRTALHLVAIKGKVTRAKLLVEAGADANCRDNHGKTALDLAREVESPETVAYLETVTNP
ncbi:hypothetical protein VHEMI01349 [[Torrubiella] hemipterigena]|uniref:Uncharacterized protein n=1 Tax=[Torrubiella] hemipterigena TaxID=1531966 RepID=A0A0A1T4J2_9HYPO|nr:hypothetical protein VHEMI01349 [[Torrubiella] hemipterigena]